MFLEKLLHSPMLLSLCETLKLYAKRMKRSLKLALQPEMLSNWVFRALYKCDPIKLLAEYVEFNEIKGIFIHGAPHRCSECQRTKIDILFSKMPKNAKIVNFLYVSGNTVTFCKQKMVKIPSSYLGRKKSVW